MQGQRGARRAASASAWSRHDRRSRCRNGQVGAELHAQARQEGRRASRSTRRSTIRPRSALGLKYVELTRGHVEARRSTTATRCRSRRPTVPVELDDVYNIFDEPRRGRPRRTTSTASATRFAGRGAATSTRRSATLPRLSVPRSRSRATWPTRSTELAQLLPGARRTRRASSRRSPRSTRGCSPTWPTTFEAISRDPQALKDTIAKSPADARRRRRTSLRVQRPFLDDTAAFSRDLARRRRTSCAARCRASTARSRSARRCSRRSVAAQRRARRTRSTRCSDLAEHADDQRGAARPDRHGDHAQPAAALPRPVPDGLQLLELLLDVRRRALLRARPDAAPPQRALLNSRRPSQDNGVGAIGRRRAGQRREHARHRRRHAVPARPAVRRRGRRRRHAPTARPASSGYPSAANRVGSTLGQATYQHVVSTRTPATPAADLGPSYDSRRQRRRRRPRARARAAGRDVHRRARRPRRCTAAGPMRRSRQRGPSAPSTARRDRARRRRDRARTSASRRRSRSSTTTRSRPTFRTANNMQPELARAHRGRQRRQGHRDRARTPGDRQAAVVTMRIDKQGPADPHATRRSRSARASSSRATSSSTSSRAPRSAPTLKRRRHDPGQPDGDAGPARPGPHHAAGRHARDLQTLLDELSHRRSPAAAPRATTARSRTGARLPATARSSPTRRSAAPSTTCRATSRTPARPPRRARPQPARSSRR